MNKKNKRLQEVATQAGVSFITAWRALNAPDLVADKTISKVKTAAEEIGYVPNAVARSLVSAKTGVVGVVVPTLDDSIFADTVQGISDQMIDAGTEFLVGLSNYSEAREEELVRAFLGRQVDGLMVTGRNHSEAAKKLLVQSGVPVVEIWDVPPEPIDMAVGFSNYDLAYQAIEYLISRGYQRIVFVTPEHRSRGVEREKGFLECLAANGRMLGDWQSMRTEPTLDGGAKAVQELLALDTPPDAIFFNGDTMAIGGLLELQERGVSIPGKLALMGVHDIPISAGIRPALSTVRVPRYEIGKRAAAALIARFADSKYSIVEDLGFEIVARQTT